MTDQNSFKNLAITIIGGIIVVAIAYFLFPTNIVVNLPSLQNSKDTLETKVYSNISKSDINQVEPREPFSESPKATTKTSHEQTKSNEEFITYINSSIINSIKNIDVCVTIIDESGNISYLTSNEIANIYSKKGFKGRIGLLRSSFISKKEFRQLYEGNSNLISKLELTKYTDYLVLGRISYSIQKGKLVSGTIICSASLNTRIISAIDKTLANSFSFNVNGNGVTESQAKESALQKLITKYYEEYSSL